MKKRFNPLSRFADSSAPLTSCAGVAGRAGKFGKKTFS
jgi:hypothetical protein